MVALRIVVLILSIGILSTDAAPTAGFAAANVRIGRGGLRHSHPGHRGIQCLPWKSPRKNIAHRWRVEKQSRRSNRCRSTSLAGTPTSLAPNIAAGSILVLSSLSGIIFENNISNSSGGHVVTLFTAALLSNVSQVVSRTKGMIPTDHFLYDWCWCIFLPASLVLALLSTSSPTPSSTMSSGSFHIESAPTLKSKPIKNTIFGMALPFMAGSIGSIIGCLISFHFVSMPYATRTTALLAGCLCASYIGGTVNFFATAKILKDDVGGGGSGSAIGSAFGSMAAADLVVMALYFAMLSTASKSAWLHRLFPSKFGGGNEVMEEQNDEIYSANMTNEQQSANVETTRKSSKWPTVTAIILSSSMAVASVFVASHLEQKVTNSFPPPFNPPGTMCAFLAVIGLLLEHSVGLLLSYDKRIPSKASSLRSNISLHISDSLQRIPLISPTLSNICFYLLFAAVGATADLSSAFAGGPMALAFASLALVVHATTITFVTSTSMYIGKWIGGVSHKRKGILNKLHWPRASWEEVLTASNAAIGGPSTAAAFASSLIPSEGPKVEERGSIDTSQYRSAAVYRGALVIAATFWGVFGYAIATGVGVTISRFLMS